ncbi:hypothetical protein ACH4XT_40250 [Streptomyces avidinii]|uniref:hypothetical protein n=1 Tax=Streptomyces avidinii TaxID=1895 RepID=UPI0037BB71BD
MNAIVATALAVALISIVLPAVIWFFAWLAHEQGAVQNDGRGLSVLAALTATATALGTWFIAVHKTVQKLKPDGEKAGLFGKGGPSLVTQVGGSWVKAVVCWLVLLLVAFFCLALMSWAALYAGNWPAGWKWGGAHCPHRAGARDRPDHVQPAPLLPTAVGRSLLRAPRGTEGRLGRRPAVRLQQ